jgi:uncharacterized protein YajQ (UPF0234 family)
MASNASFVISTGADLQEVDNAVNQALKEIQQRYDSRAPTAPSSSTVRRRSSGCTLMTSSG